MTLPDWVTRYLPLSVTGAAGAGWLLKVLMLDKARQKMGADADSVRSASVTGAADSIFKRAETLIDSLQEVIVTLQSEITRVRGERDVFRAENDQLRAENNRLRLAGR